MAFFLDRVGGLMSGMKLYGDVELTPEQFTALKNFAPEHRVAALPLVAAEAELAALAPVNNQLVIEEVTASGNLDTAVNALEELQAQLAANPEDTTLLGAIETARAALVSSRAAAEKAHAACEKMQAQMAELRDKLGNMPPRKEVAA